jgi:hypothetical protein
LPGLSNGPERGRIRIVPDEISRRFPRVAGRSGSHAFFPDTLPAEGGYSEAVSFYAFPSLLRGSCWMGDEGSAFGFTPGYDLSALCA